MRPVKDLKEFLNEYGIKGHFTEKEEMINAIKGSLNERYFQQRAKQRNLDSKARRKSQPNNPMMGVFNTFFGGKGESSKSRSKNDFMANLGAFAQEIQQVFLMLTRK